MFEGPAVIEVAGHIIRTVQVDESYAVTTFDSRDDLALDIVDDGACVKGSEEYVVV
jgi:hypothetical protein